MLFETASHEIPLLVFTVLVPMGITAMGLIGIFRSSAGLSEKGAKRTDVLLVIPVVFTIIGLIASFMHLGYPTNAFWMASGVGRSPLTNEIIVAGVSIAAVFVYWVYAMVKHPGEGIHRIFGLICLALGLVTAMFTGLAYMMETIATWSSPVGVVSQVFAALLGGAVLAAVVLSLAGGRVNKIIAVLGIVGAVGVAVAVLVQGMIAGGVQNSAGLTLAASMGQYWTLAVAGIICAVVSGALPFIVVRKPSATATAVSLVSIVIALAALVLIRICFYGIFISVGLF